MWSRQGLLKVNSPLIGSLKKAWVYISPRSIKDINTYLSLAHSRKENTGPALGKVSAHPRLAPGLYLTERQRRDLNMAALSAKAAVYLVVLVLIAITES